MDDNMMILILLALFVFTQKLNPQNQLIPSLLCLEIVKVDAQTFHTPCCRKQL